MERKSIAGRTVLVTGAARGIGLALSKRLISKGARLVMADVDPKVASEAVSLGATGVILDVRDPASWAAVPGIGSVDVLVNNAGIMPIGRFLEHTPTVDHKQFEVNVHGVINGMRAVLPGMLERRWGTVINVSSVAGRIGTPYVAVYSASKFGVIGLTEAVRAECGECGVDFGFVCPSLVDTELISGTGRPRWPPPLSAEQVADAIVEAIETRRVETYVPKTGRLSTFLPGVLPRPVYERIGRWFQLHTMFEHVDAEKRGAYQRRILGE